MKAEAHLDAKVGFEARNDVVKNGADFVRVGENAAASMLGCDTTHGTTDVPVYFGVADVIKTVGQLDKLNGLFAEDLRDNRDGVAIGFG